jgi:hypothetical protein
MAENNTILVVAVLAVIASLAAAGFSYYSLSNGGVSGFLSNTDAGTASLTVNEVLEIQFTDSTVDWGAGRVDTNNSIATLDTAAGTVENGSWAPESTGLTLENSGNEKADIDLASTDVDAAGFIGGTGASYMWKTDGTNCDSGAIDDYTEISTNAAACVGLNFVAGSNTMRADIKLVIPYDATNGAKSDTITATATKT